MFAMWPRPSRLPRPTLPLLRRDDPMRAPIRLAVFWYCRIRGRCICCGERVARRGDAQGVCDGCLGVKRDALGAFIEVEGATYPLARPARLSPASDVLKETTE